MSRFTTSLAVKISNKHILEILLKSPLLNIDGIDGKHSTALHLAVDYELEEIVEILLKHNANVNARDKYNETPLHLSCRNSNEKITEMLLNYKADVNVESMFLETPLHLSCIYGNEKITKMLLNFNANVNARNEIGENALYRAVLNKNIAIVKLLMECKANPTDFNYFQDRETPLHIAVRNNWEDLVELMLKNTNNIHVEDNNGLTPLHLALLMNFKQIIQLFMNFNDHYKQIHRLIMLEDFHELCKLKNIKQFVNLKDKNGNTPLKLAILTKNIKIVQFLLDNQAKYDYKQEFFDYLIDQYDCDGRLKKLQMYY